MATACASTSTRPHRHSAAVPRSAAARVCGTFVEVHIERPGSLSDPDAGVGPCGDPTKIEMYEKKWDLIIEGTGWDLQARGPAQNIGPALACYPGRGSAMRTAYRSTGLELVVGVCPVAGSAQAAGAAPVMILWAVAGTCPVAGSAPAAGAAPVTILWAVAGSAQPAGVAPVTGPVMGQ